MFVDYTTVGLVRRALRFACTDMTLTRGGHITVFTSSGDVII